MDKGLEKRLSKYTPTLHQYNEDSRLQLPQAESIGQTDQTRGEGGAEG